MTTSKKTQYRAKIRSESKIKPLTDTELIAIREQQILPVIKDLRSSEVTTKSAALESALKLIHIKKCRKILLREQIVKILLEQIVEDSNLQVKANGWHTLGSLAKEEEADFCVHLYRQGVLENIDANLKIIIKTKESHDPQLSGLSLLEQELLRNITISIIGLLTSLCESHDGIIEALSNFPIILKFLFELLASQSNPLEIQSEILLCLTTLTEDNKAIVEQIVQNEKWFQTLVIIKDSAKINAIYACGILHNIFTCLKWFDHNTPIKEMSDTMLVPLLINHIGQFTNDEDSSHSESISDHSLQVALEVIGSIATSLQEAIEHRSRKVERFIDSKDDDMEGGDTEIETESINGEMNDEEIDADMKMVTNSESDEDELLQSNDLTLDRLIRAATPKILRIFDVKNYFSDSINERALSALNNIAWTVSNIDNTTKHFIILQKVWASLAQEIWEQVICSSLHLCMDNMELASLITSLAWAVARSAKGIIKLSPSNEDMIISLYQISRNVEQVAHSKNFNLDKQDTFQSLGVKCIGILGNLASEPTTTIDLNRRIGKFLLAIPHSLPDVPAADVIESLNHIFDIYADESYSYDEPVFWSEQFWESLQEINQSKVKQMAKAIDRRKFKELRTRADEAILNLGRFLDYKKKEKEKKGLQ
ncbi:putative ARM-like repeat-containing protein [Erysiphe neolycopersici]|uniref:Putative ARM-like repeat-containing protein n=1 Tax=Erysiphe neolycopersici TaxID=212602 RepID=A0A420HYK9_9PEZI|nr:putative ARM-like repeat-containing protein [Erysiphe neolycopersici]